MDDIILRQEDVERFSTILSQLVSRARLLMSALIHKDGHLLSSAGSPDLVDTTALAALVSANFSSTIAVANLIGEKEFSSQFHKGNTKSIFISLMDDNTFLASIFDGRTSIDTVRVYTEEYTKGLTDALRMLYSGNQPTEPLDLDTTIFPLDETIMMPRSELAARVSQSAAPSSSNGTQARTLPHTAQSAKKETDVFYVDLLAARNPYEGKDRSTGGSAQQLERKKKNDRLHDTSLVSSEYLRKKAQEVRTYEKKRPRPHLFSLKKHKP